MVTEFAGERTWRDVMRSGESGEEVIERVLVGDIDGSEPEAPLVPFTVEEVVYAERDVEEASGSDARRVLVVILGVGGGDGKQS